MGSNRKLLSGVLFVVAGLVFWGLYSAIKRANQAVAPTPVPVAAQTPSPRAGGSYAYAVTDIPQGSIVTKEMFEMRPLKGGATTTGAVTDPEAQAVGYITRVAIPKDALIRPAGDFIGHISETGIAGALGVGKRAMTIPFANKPTLHDLVRIGNFIDVNAAFDGQEARTIVENVRVIAVDVFVNDFPQVNGAVRGPFKADPKGRGIDSSPAAPGAATSPGGAPASGAGPTPTPAPAQAPARPDPSVTLEVTPAQANTILLAQASGGTLDFVVRPALPGGLSNEPVLVNDDSAGGTGIGSATARLSTVSVTKAQIAPYAERKKAAGNSGGTGNSGGRSSGSGTRTVSTVSNGDRLRIPRSIGGGFPNPGIPSGNDPRDGMTPVTEFPTPAPPLPTPLSPTYEIPIFADGKVVRTETVRRPQD